MRRTRQPPRSLDSQAAFDSANAFYARGKYYLDRLSAEVSEGSYQRVPSGLGEVVASAANLSFALELYLKALRIKLGLPYSPTHDIGLLYSELPPRVRAPIEQSYNAKLAAFPFGKRASFTIAKGPRERPDWAKYSELPHDLPSVLSRQANTFESWRYIFEFEIPEGSQYQFHEFEYVCLDAACAVVRQYFVTA